jgi:F-type H+-transporting ATPase subunit a
MSHKMLGMLAAPAPAEGGEFDIIGMIMHHLVDEPYWDSPFGRVNFPQFPPVQVGPLTLDFSITKHVFFMALAAVIVAFLLIRAGRAAAREQRAGAERGPKGAANVLEAVILFVRDEIAMKNIGHGGERYVPYVVTIFFFIFFCNLLGLVPWGATATGNISVTATLAVMTFIVIEVAGMRELGPAGYSRTIFYAPKGLNPVMTVIMYVIMTPVEIVGKLTKPFALAIRLFANMTAGHVILLAFIGLIVSAQFALGLGGGLAAGIPALLMAVAIMLLEIFVALLQAYVFTLLSSVFIGLIRHAH